MKKNRTIRLDDSTWQNIERRTKNPSKFIRECIEKGLEPDYKETECCGTCDHWLQHKPLDGYPENILSGACSVFIKSIRITNVCKNYKLKG